MSVYQQYRYKVAENSFSVWAPRDAWESARLQSYDPFVLADDSGEDVFKMDVVLEDKQLQDLCEAKFLGDFGDEEFMILNVFKCAQDDEFIMEIGSKFDKENLSILHVTEHFSRAKLYLKGSRKFANFLFNNALMLMYAFSSARYGCMLFHSSVVMYNGKGYMFLGKSGTGKSTHTGLWLKYIPQTELLNDDNPVVRLNDNGTAVVYGTPWSGKTPCYKNKSVEVGGIVRLNQAPQNVIRKLSIVESYGAVLTSISSMKFNKNLADSLYNNVSGLVTRVPVYFLDCLPNEDAAKTSLNAITK